MAIDYSRQLNPAQLEAVTCTSGPVLVIAGAGSGKTRTIVYRLARLAQEGIAPQRILLLTFTRKAAGEMLARAGALLGHSLSGAGGGTFHAFAYRVLRTYADAAGLPPGFTVMDRADASELFAEAKDRLGLGKGDRSFPKKTTVLELVSKARNKEKPLSEIIHSEAFHLGPYADDLSALGEAYAKLKAEHGLLDYDDLLFRLEALLTDAPHVRERLHERHTHLMVDEYQDTNLVQARLVRLLAGPEKNVMAVGDDAQSIYAFRGATVDNIMRFPEDFPGTRLVRLERNYRSTQPILDLTNAILDGARTKYEKHLYTERADGEPPRLVRTLSDQSQAQVVFAQVAELGKRYPLHEIAVLFRAGYQSFALEALLNKAGVRFQKYGGIKFTEAAHIKDVLCYLRLVANPSDLPAWQRVLAHVKGIGKKTAGKVFQAIMAGDSKALAKHSARFAGLPEILSLLDGLRTRRPKPLESFEAVLTHYAPIMIEQFPDDYPRRQQGLEQLATVVAGYADLDLLLADLNIEPDNDEDGQREDQLVLSTVHSAKGLEWRAVLLIDLVEDRFPLKRSLLSPDDMEEERRLMYVACTRARDELVLLVPECLASRQRGRSEPAMPSPFLQELSEGLYSEWRETFSGPLVRASRLHPSVREQGCPSPPSFASPAASSDGAAPAVLPMGYCTHKIFGRGKIIKHIPPDKYQVNFESFGLKVIVGQYLEME